MLMTLFVASCLMSVTAFAIFAWHSVERILLLKKLNKQTGQGTLQPRDENQFDMRLQTLNLVPIDKIFDSTAKLTDSLAKAPFPVVALIASVLFLLAALAAATLECKGCNKEPPPKPEKVAVGIDTERCIVGTFAEGKSQVEDTVDKEKNQAQPTLKDFPGGCLEGIRKRLQSETPAALLIIGHVDFRELNSTSRHIYASNLSLAYQRALVTQAKIEESGAVDTRALAQRTVLLSVGAKNVRENKDVPSDLLAQDRIAEIIPLWNAPLATNP